MALQIIIGETPVVSKYLDFGFFVRVFYQNNEGLGEISLGMWIGVSYKVGQFISYWILTISGNPISCTKVQRIKESEKHTNTYKVKMKLINNHLTDHITARDKENDITNVPDWNQLSIAEQNPKFDEYFNKVVSNDGVTEANDSNAVKTPDIFDSYIKMEVGLPRGNVGELHHATVKRRALNYDGNLL